MSEIDDQPCRVVELEWDRGHDTFHAIVRADTSAGVIVTKIPDITPEPGLIWIRGDEVLELDDLSTASAAARLATRRGTGSEPVDPAFTNLPMLLAHLIERRATVSVFQRRTGSDELLVGVATTFDDGRFHMAEIDPDGRYTDDDLDYVVDDIIRVDWDNDYLLVLRELADGDEPPID